MTSDVGELHARHRGSSSMELVQATADALLVAGGVARRHGSDAGESWDGSDGVVLSGNQATQFRFIDANQRLARRLIFS